MDSVQKRTISKLMWRLAPFTSLLYLIALLDRVNIGYAGMQMNKELGIGPAAFGALAAAFFVGYFFFEVPSNMILERVGSRKWIARIMVSWGIVTCLVFFATKYWHIYVLRLLLGVMEAGILPGLVFYFTLWFPTKQRAKVVAYLFVGSQLGMMLGSPLAGLILDNISWFGRSGWRWLFIFEGLPAIIMGIATWFYLPDKPKDAKWLAVDEKQWLVNKLETERALNKVEPISIAKSFANIKVWHLAAIYFCFQIAAQTITFWMPLIIKGFSATFTNTAVGFIGMLPPLFSIFFVIFWGAHSDRSGERKFHMIIPILVSICGFLFAAFSKNPATRVAGMIVAQAGTVGFFAPFWSLPSVYVTGMGAAIGIAIINSCSSASGFFGNMAVGRITAALGPNAALVFMIITSVITIGLILAMRLQDVALQADTKSQADASRVRLREGQIATMQE